MSLSDNLKRFRINKDLTQKELAEKSGVTRESIGNYERGDRIPPADILEKIATAFNVSVSTLLWDDTKFIKDLLSSFQAAYHTKKNYFPENHQIINILIDEQILSEERLDILLDDFNNLSIDEIQKILFYIKKLDLDTYNKFLNDTDIIKMQILGKNIQTQRNKNNLSIQDLSLKCALDSSYLERLENGFSDYPPNDMIRKIAEILRITVTDLIGEMKKSVDKIFPLLEPQIVFLSDPRLERVYDYSYTNLATCGYENLLIMAIEKAIKTTLSEIKEHEENGDLFDGLGSWISKESPVYEIVKKSQQKNKNTIMQMIENSKPKDDK